MTRRELYRFVESLRDPARKGGDGPDDKINARRILDAFRLAMHHQRGLDVDARDGEVELLPLLDCDAGRAILALDDALGRIYQALNAPALESAYRATSRDRRKFAAGEIHAVSQLFTPRWVVAFLLHNTLGKLWIELHPDTRLREKLNWLVEADGDGMRAGIVGKAETEVGRPFLPATELMSGGHSCPPRINSKPLGGDKLRTCEFEADKNVCSTETLSRSTGRGRATTSSREPIRAVRTLRVLDPACGTMNFGLVAYELLHEMYAEEIDRAGQTGWSITPSVTSHADIPAAILRNNLFGIDIDPVALDLARTTLRIKAGVDLPDGDWNLWHGDSLFDENIARRCAGGFDVVATNPPYVSSRNLAADHVARMKKRFPASWRDLYACFIERSLDFANDGGRVGLLTMQSFLFTGAYQKLRAKICDQAVVEALAHFGPGLFDIGNPGTLQTVAFVARKRDGLKGLPHKDDPPLVAFRLTNVAGEKKQAALQSAIVGNSPNTHLRYERPQSALSDLPRQSWAYWVDAPLRRAFASFPRLADISPPRQGLATTDNARFVRYWWEVEPTHRDAPARATPGKWFPYAKSGQFRRWYESPRHRVNWQDDGREIKQAIVDRYPYLNGQWRWVAKNTGYYGRRGVTWSYLTSGRFSARRLEPGSIFDVAGSSLFPDDVPGMLALLNSSAIHRLLEAINPTVNFQVGDLAELPVPAEIPAGISALAESAIQLQQKLDASDETAPDFVEPIAWDNAVEESGAILTDLFRIEQENDRGVCAIYGLDHEPAAPAPISSDRTDLARRWMSFAVGLLLGRWNAGEPGRVLQIVPLKSTVLSELRETLRDRAGEAAAMEIESQVGGMEKFFAGEFYAWHVRLYRNRPPYWALRAGDRIFLIAHDAITERMLTPIVKSADISLPRGWERRIDDGIQSQLMPFRKIVADGGLRKVLEKLQVSGK